MVRNSDFNIEFQGLDELIALFESQSRSVENEMVRQMKRYKSVVEGGTKRLAPVDTKALEKSITSTDVRRNGNEYYFLVGSDLEYALKMHEHTGNWGECTQLKQSRGGWRGYIPGDKFLQNAIYASEEDWDIAMQNVLNNTIGKGRL